MENNTVEIHLMAENHINNSSREEKVITLIDDVDTAVAPVQSGEVASEPKPTISFNIDGSIKSLTGTPSAAVAVAAAAAAMEGPVPRMPSTATLVALSEADRRAAWKRMEYPPGYDDDVHMESVQ